MAGIKGRAKKIRLTDAQRLAAEANARLIDGATNYALTRYPMFRNWRNHDIDDIRQIVSIGYMKAVATYDLSRGATLKTHVYRVATRHAEATWRIAHTLGRGGGAHDGTCMDDLALSLDRLTEEHPCGDFAADQYAENPESMLERLAMQSDLRDAIENCLTPREREIALRVADGETLETIAQDYGVTRERIRQINTIAIRKLRTELIRNGYAELIPVANRDGRRRGWHEKPPRRTTQC